MDPIGVIIENVFHCFGGAHRQRTFLNDDFGGGRVFYDLPRCLFPILEIGGFAGALPEGFGRRVDADEDDIRFGNVGVQLRWKKTSSCPASSPPLQTGLVHKLATGPTAMRPNTGGIDITTVIW